MESPQRAIFQLNRYAIPKFSIEVEEENEPTIDIKLLPEGTYNSLTGEFILVLTFIGSKIPVDKEKERKIIVSAHMKGYYTIHDKPDFEKIPDYFFQNSLAILFPYLRAFISTLSLQAGIPLLVLPLLNLSHLSSSLKEKTTVFK